MAAPATVAGTEACRMLKFVLQHFASQQLPVILNTILFISIANFIAKVVKSLQKVSNGQALHWCRKCWTWE